MRPAILVVAAALSACARPVERVPGTPAGALARHGVAAQDTTPKADPRLVPPEAYMRTYLHLFGELTPLDTQKKARAGENGQLFDTWNDYVSALGFPDYRLDVPRQTQTNALMIATFERLGVALCDRSVEHDLGALGRKPAAPLPLAERVVFAFDPPKGAMTAEAFAERFDVLHRTFLGYPASLAPPERTPRFHALYTDIAKNHVTASPKSRFSPEQAAWAAVCYGLVRHPEFHLY